LRAFREVFENRFPQGYRSKAMFPCLSGGNGRLHHRRAELGLFPLLNWGRRFVLSLCTHSRLFCESLREDIHVPIVLILSDDEVGTAFKKEGKEVVFVLVALEANVVGLKGLSVHFGAELTKVVEQLVCPREHKGAFVGEIKLLCL